MAAATWADHDTNGRLTRALNDARALLDGDDDDDASVGSSGLSVILPAPVAAEPHFMVVRRFLLRHIGWVYAIQETLLLLMIGVSANLLAFLLDHLIEALVMGRAAAAQAEGSFLPSYAVWTGSALVLCALSAMVVQFIGPASAGSGIPQMKSVLGGMRMHNYLSLRTMVAKMLSLVLALAGGLSVGKEGPYVHITSCAAACLTRLPGFRRLGQASRLAVTRLPAVPRLHLATTSPPPRHHLGTSAYLGCLSRRTRRCDSRCSPPLAPPASPQPLARRSAGCSSRSR